jgi:hypothetical protein
MSLDDTPTPVAPHEFTNPAVTCSCHPDPDPTEGPCKVCGEPFDASVHSRQSPVLNNS